MALADTASYETIYLDAMAAGLHPDKMRTIFVEPFTGIEWHELLNRDDFRVVHGVIRTDQSNHEILITVILYLEKPVWSMHADGWCEPEAAEFLKECRAEAYVNKRRFYGGFGPSIVEGQGFTYFNKMEMDTFAVCRGEEDIVNWESKIRCHYRYTGSLL